MSNLSVTLSSNNTSDFDHNSYFATTRNLVGIWEFLIFVVGGPLNLLVICLAWTLMRIKTRNTSQWFVLSMTLADFLFTVIHAPMMFAYYSLNVSFNSSACLTMYITTYSCTTASSLSLLLLNIDKFIYLHKPLHYFLIVTKPKVILATLISWILAFIWALFFLLGPFSVYTPPCDFHPNKLNFYIFFAIFFFTLPIIISLIISIYIAVIVVKAKQEKQLRQKRHFRLRNNDSNSSDKTEIFGTIDHLKTISFVFTTTIWSSISCLPYRIAYIIYVTPSIFTYSHGKIYLFYFLFALMATNAVGNPYITIVTQHQYSQKVREIFGKVSKQKFVSSFSRASTSMTMTNVHSVVDSRKPSLEKDLPPKGTVTAVNTV